MKGGGDEGMGEEVGREEESKGGSRAGRERGEEGRE